jgi:uncharacterized protein (TIGR02246 family)
MASNDEAQIRDLLARYERALNAADAAAAGALYAPDGEWYPYNLPTAGGQDIEGSYRSVFDTIKLDVAFTIHEIVASGDIAYAVTGSQGQVTVLATGQTGPEENREMFTFARVGGEWKIRRYMFNKPAAPATAGS